MSMMGRTCSVTCTKTFLVIYNFVFLLAGCGLLGAGIWLRFDKTLINYLVVGTASADPTPDLERVSYAVIGLGTGVMLLSFMGCCGACCESMCLLCLYAFLLFMVLAGELAVGIYVAVTKETIEQSLQSTMQMHVKLHYNRTKSGNTTDLITRIMDVMQVDLSCCGSIGPQDYRHSAWFNQTEGQGLFVPATCCYMSNDDPDYPMVMDQNQCQIDAILYPLDIVNSNAVKTRGCHQSLLEALQEHSKYIILVVCAVATLQILSIVVACCLMTAMRREQSKYPWYHDVDDD